MSARVREVLLLAGRQNSSALPRAQGGGGKGCLRFPAGHCDSVLRCAPRAPTQVAGRGPPQSGIRRAGRHPLPLTPSSWWRPRGLPPLRGQEPRPRREARQALVDRSSSRLSASPGGGAARVPPHSLPGSAARSGTSEGHDAYLTAERARSLGAGAVHGRVPSCESSAERAPYPGLDVKQSPHLGG